MLFKRYFFREQDIANDKIKLEVQRCTVSQINYWIYLRSTGEHIGYCDLRLSHSSSNYYYGNIGYRIFPAYRGHSYAYEAAKLLLQVAKNRQMHYVLITVSPENTPSVRTCEKLGGEYLGTYDVPDWHPLYAMDEKIKRIYRYDLPTGG